MELWGYTSLHILSTPPGSEAVLSIGPFFPFFPGGCRRRETIRRTAENHPINWAEGRALHAAMTCPGAIPLKTARMSAGVTI